MLISKLSLYTEHGKRSEEIYQGSLIICLNYAWTWHLRNLSVEYDCFSYVGGAHDFLWLLSSTSLLSPTTSFIFVRTILLSFIQHRPHSATTDIPLSNSQGILSVGIHDWRYSEVTSTSSIYIKSHPTQSSPGHHCSMKRKRGTIHHPGLLSCRRWKPESPGSAILQSGSWMVGKQHVETSSRRH